MASKKTRTKVHRRDRRKAKASNWKRGPKQKMNGTVVHGPTGSNFTYTNGPVKSNDPIKFTKEEVVKSSLFKQNIWEGQESLAEIQEDLQLRDTKNFQIGLEKGVEAYWDDISFENPYDSAGSTNAFFRGWNRGWELANNEIMESIRLNSPLTTIPQSFV